MHQSFERRRAEREKYLVLRVYARLLTGLGYVVLVGGVLFAVLVLVFAEVPMQLRISNAFTALVMAAVYFVIVRATAQAIYLLFDVARNSKASRELLEKTAAPAPQPKPAPGD